DQDLRFGLAGHLSPLQFCPASYSSPGVTFAAGRMPIFFFTVEQQERAIVERFGKFVRVGGPGLQTKTPFVERVAGRLSLQVEQLNSQIETKTKDNVFVVVMLAVQYKAGAEDQQVQDAYYKLDNPEVQMQAYAFDVVRSHIPSMDLDEAYADADTIAK